MSAKLVNTLVTYILKPLVGLEVFHLNFKFISSMNDYIEYELIYIISNFEIENIEKIKSAVEKNVLKYEGKIKKTSEPQKRKLAYQIKGSKVGFYMVSRVEMKRETVNQFQNDLKMNNRILRSMVVKTDDLPSGDNILLENKAKEESDKREKEKESKIEIEVEKTVIKESEKEKPKVEEEKKPKEQEIAVEEEEKDQKKIKSEEKKEEKKKKEKEDEMDEEKKEEKKETKAKEVNDEMSEKKEDKNKSKAKKEKKESKKDNKKGKLKFDDLDKKLDDILKDDLI